MATKKIDNRLLRIIRKVHILGTKRVDRWAKSHIAQLAIYNIVIIVLVLLNSAGYFHPFFPITINIISLVALVGAIILLGARSRLLFVFSVAFLLFAGLMLILNVRIWADRTMIYSFQSLLLGIVLLFLEETDNISS